MARAPDAPTITGGQIDPYVQQSLMQGKQQASNRLIAAMQEQGAVARQSMAGQQQMEQQKLAGEQAAQRSAAEIGAEDRRAAEVERGRREDATEQKRQYDETQKLTTRLADRQFALEKAIGERDYESAERMHREIMADTKLQRILERDYAEEAMKVMVASLRYKMGKELSAEKEKTIITGMKNKEGEIKSGHEQTMISIRENLLADNRFDVFFTPRAEFTVFGVGAKGLRGIWKHGSASITNAIQRQATDNGSDIPIENLRSERYAALERDVAAGKTNETSIRAMYTILEASKEAIRSKLKGASERDEKEWNSQLLLIDGYERSLDRLKSSAEKIAGSDTKTVGAVARTGLDVVQGTGTPGIMDRITMGQEDSEQQMEAFLSDITKAIEPSSRKRIEYTDEDSDEFKKRADEENRSRGFDISMPSIPIAGGH